MQIAQVLAGYTLGGADLLRRAMGKKKPEEMAKQRSVFVEGAVARGVDRGHAPAQIFDLMEKFAGYGFNKSHSAAYALLAYQTAWLKAHYPEAFMAAVLSSDMEHTDKVVSFIDECEGIGLEVLPPDINHLDVCLHRRGTRHDPLRPRRREGRRRVGGGRDHRASAAAAGRSATSRDLCRRVDLKITGRRTLEAMVKSGCFDGFGCEPRDADQGIAGRDAARRAAHARGRRRPGRPVRRPGGQRRSPGAVGARPGCRAGVERRRAPAGGARHAGPVPDRASDHRGRGGAAPARAGTHRRPGRPAPDCRVALRRRQERDDRGPRARDPSARRAHDAAARRQERTHRGQPVRRRLAAASCA